MRLSDYLWLKLAHNAHLYNKAPYLMAKLYIVSFSVRGSGEFPFDMLRYDGCHPVNESQARDIARTYAKGDAPLTPRTVRLETRGRPRIWFPTEGRWNSFGWVVERESIESRAQQ